MKKINKKISAVALAGTLIAGTGLSQGLVGHADSGFVPKTLLSANLLKNDPQGGAYTAVEKHQYDSNYNAIYLGNGPKFNKFIKRIYQNKGDKLLIPQNYKNEKIPSYYNLIPNHKYFYLEFTDGAEFSSNIHKLDKYKKQKDPIVVKIKNEYFGIFFYTTDHERNVMPIKQLGESYDFEVFYAHSNSDPHGKATMESFITKNDTFSEEEKKRLLEELNDDMVFLDAEELAYDLKNGIFTIPKGFSRCQIGNYEYIFSKNSK